MTQLATAPLMFAVFVQGSPKAQPRARAASIAGHARLYTPSSAKGWRERVWSALLPWKPLEPYDEPLELRLDFEFQRPASHWSKRTRLKASAPRWVGSRPDCDNLAKAVMDEMSEGAFWRDDALVVDLRVTKRYSDDPGRFGCLVTLLRAP